MDRNQSKPLLAIFIVFLSNMLASALAFILAILAPFFPKIRRFLHDRHWSYDRCTDLRSERNRKKHCVLFFCSSAGEYEQAKPLAHLLAADSHNYVHIIFFSSSGFSFAK